MGAFAAAYPLLTTAATAAAGSLAVGALMKPDTPTIAPPPTLTPPTPMPDEKGIKNAARRTSILEQQRRRGRASTILTDAVSDVTDSLGG